MGVIIKPFFTIHEGEFLVGDHITRKFSGKYEVWVPAKDNGVDLLVTPSQGKGRAIKLQVKFSRGWAPRCVPADQLLAWGWYTLKPAKIRKSKADVWAFVILTLRHQPYFILVPIKKLIERIPRNAGSIWHLYLAVLRGHKCYDLRGLTRPQIAATVSEGIGDSNRDFSDFLDRWDVLT